MSRTSSRAKLILDEAKRTDLRAIASSRTDPLREVQRAKILLRFSDGIGISQIKKELKVSRPTIYKCIDKALRMGVDSGLRDTFHRPKAPVITEEAKTWVVNLACTKPKEHGYAAEVWTRKQLALHARKFGPEVGHLCLAKAAKATIQRMLDQHPLRPHKMAYYTVYIGRLGSEYGTCHRSSP
jgi:transposase